MNYRYLRSTGGRFFLGAILLLLLSGSATGFPSGEKHSSRIFSPPSLTHQIFQYVDWKYVDPGRARPDNLLEGAFKHLETRYPEILIERDREKGAVTVKVDEKERLFTLARDPTFSEAATVIEEVLAFAGPLVKEDTDDEKMLRYMTINGSLRELDPHSNVFSMKHFKDFKVRTSGSFGGIGFTFGVHDGDLTIISPIPDTPADRAGLLSGDKILFIDGEPTTNMGTDSAVSRMRGEPRTKVTLTIGREGWTEPRDFPIVREIIKIVSVEKHRLTGEGAPPALYTTIKNFQENTAEELRRAIKEADSEEMTGVILDLRNNPGGLLQEAIAVSEGFLDEGVIVSTRSRDQEKVPREAGRLDTPFTRKPLIVLINRGSASASEIVAGALQESRALVLGQKSFGKGSVQQAYSLMDGGGLLLTVSQYLTPGDISIQSIGIQPDIITVPVEVGPGKIRLTPPRNHPGEATLENAFNEWGNARREEIASLKYLKPPPPPLPEEGFLAPTAEEKLAGLNEDFEILLARRILGRAHSKKAGRDRDSLAAAAVEEIAATGEVEKSRISAALGDLGIDWSTPSESAGQSRLNITFPEDLSLAAGSTAHLTLSVKNEGDLPAYRVWGGTDSDNPLLKNLDFAFGRIEPGEERSWTADIEVPKGADNRWDKITLTLKTESSEEAGTFTGGAFTRSQPLPPLAYSYTLLDENPDDPSRDGDGILEEGERARIILDIHNESDSDTATLEVNLHADEKENFYLDQVRHRLENVLPGEHREAELSFRLLEAKKNGEVEIRITLHDRDRGRFFSDKLKFQAGKPYPGKESRIPPRFSLVEPLPVRTTAESVLLELEVTDDEAVKEVYAYRGEKKISYLRNRAGGSLFPIKMPVPLEIGTNRLVVIARDQKNIPAERVFYIHRTADKEEFSEVQTVPVP